MYKTTIPILLTFFCIIPSYGMKVFDMKEIRDPSTLKIKILQDWHRVKGVIETRQNLPRPGPITRCSTRHCATG